MLRRVYAGAMVRVLGRSCQRDAFRPKNKTKQRKTQKEKHRVTEKDLSYMITSKPENLLHILSWDTNPSVQNQS